MTHSKVNTSFSSLKFDENAYIRTVEEELKSNLDTLRNKTPEELLELIKECGKGKSRLFFDERVKYGLNNEINELKAVLVHRPGPEVELVDENDPWKWLMFGKPDLSKALPEYDNMIELIKKESKAKVIFLSSSEEKLVLLPNQWFTRDHGFMTPYGAVIGNPDTPRMYEEYFVMRKLLALDIPIIFKVYGEGKMEGGDIIYLDEKTLLIGQSYRTNQAGYKQIKSILERWVVDKVVPVPLRSDIMHLDTVFNVASRDVVAVYADAVPKAFIDFVKSKGFDIIFIPEEEYNTLAVNWLCLAPGKVLFIDGEKMNVTTRKELEKRGIDVVSFRMPELLKGAGGPRCMTMPLSRSIK